MNNKITMSLLAMVFSILSMQNVNAELFNTPNKTSKTTNSTKTTSPLEGNIAISNHMKIMASFCVNHWDNEKCLKELSSLSMDLTTNYAEKLDAQKKEVQMENLKQHCAASTAALKVSVPAYAMKSAITECINIISDINDETSIKPDIDLYQLLVGSVLCLGKDLACDNIETQLSDAAK